MAGRRHSFWRVLGTLIAGGLFLFFLAALVLSPFERRAARPPIFRSDSVAVVEIEGLIRESKETIRQLQNYEEDATIKAIVLRVDSPGGGVAPAQEIYEEVVKIKEKKPVVASLGGVAASGGYYIASACDAIVANPGTITGSIGVIVQIGNIEELLQKVGLRGYTIKSGEHKDMGSPLKKLTPESKEIFQTLVENIHGQFVGAVAKGRKMDPRTVEKLADGRIYSGEQAKELGLVDFLGNLQDAVEIAGRKGGIKGKPHVVSTGQPSKGWLLRFLSERVQQAIWSLFFHSL